MDKIIFQTFWTAPMVSFSIFRDNVYIAGLSLAYAHRSGYKVRMHTDNRGYEVLKDLGYDWIQADLEDIPKDINPNRFFAYPKYFAGLREPLGRVHTDFDVFLKKPCIDAFFEGKCEFILQNRELFSEYGDDYKNLRIKMYETGYPDSLPISHLIASNVGVIGFNNQELKDSYYKVYFDYIDYYKDIWQKFDGLNTELMAEQITADYMAKDYKTLYLLPSSGLTINNKVTEYADFIGYQHLQGSGKYNTYARTRIVKILRNKFPDMYNKLINLNI